MKKMISTIIIITAALLPLHTEAAEDNWELTKNSSGVKIFQRENKTTGIYEFLGITSINKSYESIFNIVNDVTTNKYWMADCTHSSLVKKDGRNSFIAYYITSPPWPVEKRDSVISVTVRPDRKNNLIKVTMKSLNKDESVKLVKKSPSLVRVEHMDGYVILKKTGTSQAEVRFFVSGSPGGNVPDFIARWGGWMIPYKTLTGLKEYISSKSADK